MNTINMHAQTETHGISSVIDANTTQCLTFRLADEEYGVEIMKVQEIRSWEPVTAIPNTPDYIIGVINLRGIVVPIINLRQRFNLAKVEHGASTVIIIVKVEHKDKQHTMGIVVDAVSEVYNISEENLRKTPEFGSAISTQFVRGLVNVDDKMIILLDIDLLISPEHLAIKDIEKATDL